MSLDKSVYITMVNFNHRNSIIDIDQQFYPTSRNAEVLIDSVPNAMSTTPLNGSQFTISMTPPNADIDLGEIELQPYQSLLLKVGPT